MLSLFIDDAEDPDWQDDDDIEEVSSPNPPRRMGTRMVPSASQSLAAGLDSDIEEVDSPVLRPQPKVTLITPEDLVDYRPTGGQTIEECCQKDLSDLRDKIYQEDKDLAGLLSDDVLFALGAMLPSGELRKDVWQWVMAIDNRPRPEGFTRRAGQCRHCDRTSREVGTEYLGDLQEL
ncbi:hypothetical protein BD311DRAFT_307689 [Dichomitus squalens]|uniref:Uncharacterized protein n=1 Tax=Dichomitus squalens TaxID=114155 RepID=A0A4Q9MMW9_9APHY|nr:hypothetical protein BD311DRAFT_307689 [Dichomitus squalens]